MVTAKYQFVLNAVASTPWAIEQRRLNDIVNVLMFQAAGGKMSKEDIRATVGQKSARGGEQVSEGGSVAVIGLRGIISHRMSMMEDVSGPGGSSAEGFTNSLKGALDDERVKAIVIDVDSPGGSVDGVPEAARSLREARGRKPIVAVANTLAASAAYYIAAQADEVSITESGSVGSIGVFTAHQDISEALKQQGIKMTLISAGKHKVEGNQFEPLSDEAFEHIQSRVNESFDQFVSAVALGRNVSEDVVLGKFGQGRTFGAEEAVKIGMADRVETLQQAIARVSSASPPKSRRPRRAGGFAFSN